MLRVEGTSAFLGDHSIKTYEGLRGNMNIYELCANNMRTNLSVLILFLSA